MVKNRNILHDSRTDQDITVSPDGDLVVTLDDEVITVVGALVPFAHDYITVTRVAAGNGAGKIETAVYKTGGAGGTTVATLTLAYDSDDKFLSVVRT